MSENIKEAVLDAELSRLEDQINDNNNQSGNNDLVGSSMRSGSAEHIDDALVGRSLEAGIAADGLLVEAINNNDARSGSSESSDNIGHKKYNKNEKSQVRSFSNFEDTADPLFNTTKRKDIYKYRWIYALSYFSILSGPAIWWRFSSLFIQLIWGPNRQWDSVNIWTPLIPFGILMIVVGWPILMMEAGTSNLARGGAMQVFGSIGTRLRPVGLTFMVALATTTFMPLFVSDAFSAMVYSFDSVYPAQMAVQYPDSPYCIISHEYGDHWPGFVGPSKPYSQSADLRRLLEDRTEEISLNSVEFNYNNTRAVNGIRNLRESPKRFSILQKSSGTENWWHAPSYSMNLYCSTAAAFTIDYGTAYENADLLTKNANWNQSGVWWNYRKIISICVIWMLACLYSLLGHTKMQWVRPIFWLFSLFSLLACVSLGAIVLNHCIYSSLLIDASGTMNPQLFRSVDATAVFSPVTWAFMTSQVLLSLNLGQGIVQEFTYNSGKFTQNLVADNSWFMFISAITNIGWGFVTLMGALIGTFMMKSENTPMAYLQMIEQMVKNAPGQEIFTAINNIIITYDMTGGLPTDFNPAYLWTFFIFFGLFLAGINSIAAALQAMVMGFAGNLTRENPSRRGAFTFAFGLLCLALNIILCWSVGYGFAMGLCQYAVSLLLPLATYIEVTAVAWFIGWDWFTYHMGSAAAWVQFVMVHSGYWIVGLGVAFTYWDCFASDDVLLYTIFLIIGLSMIILGMIIPPLFAKSQDKDITKQSMWFRYKTMFWGRTEILRDQINVTCCHNTKFWRLTPIWSFLIRYVAPGCCVVSFCIPIASALGTVHFSAYFPFKLEGYITDSRLPTLYLALSSIIPLLAVLLWFIFTLVPNVLVKCKCTPKGAMPIHFLPKDAAVLFASKESPKTAAD